MSQRFRFKNNMAEAYDSVTFETIPWGAHVKFEDDFHGLSLIAEESGSPGRWETVEVALNTAIGLLADYENGAASLLFDADSNAEDAVLYWGNNRGVNLKATAQIEFRARVTVLPTLTSQIVMGLAGDHNLDKDAVTEAAWFKFDGDGIAVAESDDTTNNNDDIATGVTVLTTEWRVYRIDFSVLSDVRFYIDGAAVALATTFDMSNLTDAEAVMQPYFSIDKGADAGLGNLDIDYVRTWSKRTA